MKINDKATYSLLMEKGAAEGLDSHVWVALKEYAKSKRVKAPAPEWKRAELVLAEGSKRTKNVGKACSVRGCTTAAKVKGRCVKHDAQERRKDPEVRARANAASKASYARKKAREAEEKKAVSK